MKRFTVVAGLALLLFLPSRAAGQCDPIQFSEPYGWLIGNGCCFEPADVANRISQKFLDNGIRVRDAELAKSLGLYERYDLYVSQLAYQDNGDGTWDADLLVSVSDWQGKKFKPGTPPAAIEPCEPATLIHTKKWHVDSENDATSSAPADYYYANRNNIPREFYTPPPGGNGAPVPALGHFGLGALIALILASSLYAMYKRSPAAK